jgi:hypothetical protein
MPGVSGGNVGGREAAVEPTGMYSRRFPEEASDIRDHLARRGIGTYGLAHQFRYVELIG